MTDPNSIMLAVRNIRRSVAIKPATSSAVSIKATIAKSQNRRSSDRDARGGGAGKRWSINTMFRSNHSPTARIVAYLHAVGAVP